MQKSSIQCNAIPTALSRKWGVLLGLGIFFIILGFIGMGMTIMLTLVSVMMLGVLFMIGGGAQIVDAFTSKHWQPVLLHAVIGILYLIGGGLVIYDPILASVIITMMLAWVFIFIGITRFAMALKLRHTNSWGWLMLSACVSVILGVLILLQWPLSGLWIIGLFIAIELMINGWTFIFLARTLRRSQG